MFQIRKGNEEDLQWANARYQELNFAPSTLSRDFLAIAFVGEKRVGVGRIMSFSDDVAELGGMYVVPDHRRQGIAEAIIQFLLRNCTAGNVYCIPYERLQNYYMQFGFNKVTDFNKLPAEVQQRFSHCKGTLGDRISLLIHTGSALRK